MGRRIFRITMAFLIVVFAILGISLTGTIFDDSFNAMIDERDEQLYSLADTVDQMLTHKIQEVYLDYKLVMSEGFYKEAEVKFLESGDTRRMKEIFNIEDLKAANKLQGILIYNGQELTTIKGDPGIKQYTFFEDQYDMHAVPCCDENGNYYVAVLVDSEESALKYYFLIDLSSLYEDMISEDMKKTNWIVFYNADSGLSIQNHDNQPVYKVFSKEEIAKRQDGYTIIMNSDLSDQKVAETYQYSNYSGVVVDERMIVVPASQTENRLFAIGISRDSGKLYDTLRRNYYYQIIWIVCIVALCFGMIVIIHLSVLKEKKIISEKEHLAREHEMALQLADAQIRNSVSQMQPHFMYNVLASIRELILEDAEYAADMLYEFTWYLRACIRALGSKELIPFSQELANIKAYVKIEQMRMGDGLKVDYQIQDQEFMIPSFGIQPIVENAIKHGIARKRGKQGLITIRTEYIGNDHVICIEDDGVGFDYEKVLEEIKEGKRDSTGVLNTRFRLSTMLHAKIDVESVPGEGTKVTVSIPDDPSWNIKKSEETE